MGGGNSGCFSVRNYEIICVGRCVERLTQDGMSRGDGRRDDIA